ncbi:hypothetical protein GCM10009797_01230 [Nocardioides hwasunensis]
MLSATAAAAVGARLLGEELGPLAALPLVVAAVPVGALWLRRDSRGPHHPSVAGPAGAGLAVLVAALAVVGLRAVLGH